MFQFINFLLIFLIPVFAFDPNSNSNVAVYWGQNSGGNQQRLSYYCDSDAADIYILSFMHMFPNPIQLNFANACEGTFTPNGILKCDTIAADIQYCQSKGKIVLLSLGGAAGSYGFTSDAEGKEFAHTVWDLFGNSQNLPTADRPFGDAILDGFDFDIENNVNTGYNAMAVELKQIFAQDTSKNYYLGAAPQCPYPDASVGPLLENSHIDFVFIQFYNNYCNLGSSWFNWNTWLDYATNVSPNKDVKLYVGVPGAIRAAGSGYNSPDLVSEYLTSDITSSPFFGGISMWDVSAAWDNVDPSGNFVQNIKAIVNDDIFTAATVSTSSTSSTSDIDTTTTTTVTITSTTTTSSTTPTTSSTSSTSTTSTTDPTTSSTSTSSTSTSSTSTSTTSTSTTSTSTSTTSTSTTSTSTTSTSTTSSSTSTTTSTTPTTSTTFTSTSSSIIPTTTSETSSIASIAQSTTEEQKETSSIVESQATPQSPSDTSETVYRSSLTTLSTSLISNSPLTTQQPTTTSQNIFTSYVFAPTTFTTIATFYEIITTRTHLNTIYGRPPTTAT
ncbi:CHT3 [Candida jiufengensis]|uniref:CHT3 n=1 Tax=Candida jiufengensis TaxID=497108 RepID=UPI0022253417|nr:CHT3 [Candida jiufengensis]KAI5957271.1 CHT3 [Candida jiufengensis]